VEDASIDFGNLGRKEILEKFKLLKFNASTNSSTEQLRAKLKNLVKIHHPIHHYISQLTREEVNNVYFTVFPLKKRQIADRVRKSIANEFFKNYPRSPLVALKFCIENGKVPEMNDLKQEDKKYEKEKVSKNKDKNEPSEKQEPKAKKCNSSRKKTPETNHFKCWFRSNGRVRS